MVVTVPLVTTRAKSVAGWPSSFVALGAVAELSNFDEVIASSAILAEVTFPGAIVGSG